MKKILASLLLLVSSTVSAQMQIPEVSHQVQQISCGLKDVDTVVTDELANEVLEKIKRLLVKAAIKLDGFYFDYPIVLFDIPSGLVTAGYYNFDHNVMMLNPIYLNKYKEKFIDEVVTHEVAHLIAGPEPDNGHGPKWFYVMQKVFKVKDPQPYHHYNLCTDPLTNLPTT